MTQQCREKMQAQEKRAVQEAVQSLWRGETLEELKRYVGLPCKSKDFDANWESNGFLRAALDNAAAWGAKLFPEATFEVLSVSGKTPALYFDIPTTDKIERPAVFFYGHLDKQPEADGWSNGRKPFEPSVEGNRLYGRGAADDGYNFYAAMTAARALDAAGTSRPRIVGLYETDEECGSRDYAYWLDLCRARMGRVGLIVVMDCGGPDYERLWVTSNFRGSAVLTLNVRVLEHGVHSGLASGIAPSSFMIARALLDRIENSKTGEMAAEALNVEIPSVRLEQMRRYADTVGERVFSDVPWTQGTHARNPDPFETVVMNTWKPQLCVTGAEGIPPVASAGNVLRAGTTLKLSVRLPPTADAGRALEWLTQTLVKEPMFGCRVTVTDARAESGWNAPQEEIWLQEALNEAGEEIFGTQPVYCGCGGTIGILSLFDRSFAEAQYLLTGVLGAESNAHGPNEMLRLDYVEKLTRAVAQVIAELR